MVGARNPASNALFLEALQVGQRFSSGFHTIDEAQIKAFAAQFDPQPFHLDGEAAKATLFSGLAASGWHTAAITMKLLVESGLPLRGESSALVERSAGDRKSTRLNSSHSQISYAVFCLKKK